MVVRHNHLESYKMREAGDNQTTHMTSSEGLVETVTATLLMMPTVTRGGVELKGLASHVILVRNRSLSRVWALVCPNINGVALQKKRRLYQTNTMDRSIISLAAIVEAWTNGLP